jgi:hypothetical protein
MTKVVEVDTGSMVEFFCKQSMALWDFRGKIFRSTVMCNIKYGYRFEVW